MSAPGLRGDAVVLVLAGGRLSLPLQRRAVIAGGALALLALCAGVLGLAFGGDAIAPGDVLAVLAGGGDYYDRVVIEDFRLPRVLCGLLVGGALGMTGAIFQSLTRNPLGSPDIIGFGAGAATGALLLIIVAGAGAGVVATGSIAGGLATAVAVYLLARRGTVQAHRLVLVGLGVAAMLEAFNGYLVSIADTAAAQQAQVWLLGTLNGRTWGQTATVAAGLCLLAPPALLLGRPLRALELGDDAAIALGAPVHRARGALLLIGTLLAALATAAAGPIVFVALAAPQVARRIARTPHLSPALSALTGATLLVAADLLAQHAVPGTDLPVGVCTATLGGAYLVWLLTREQRAGRG